MLRWRLLLGTLLIVRALVGLCWLDANAAVPGIWLLPVAIVVTMLATKEVLDLLAAAGHAPDAVGRPSDKHSVRRICRGCQLYDVSSWLSTCI